MISATGVPPSCCRKANAICSGVKCFFFMNSALLVKMQGSKFPRIRHGPSFGEQVRPHGEKLLVEGVRFDGNDFFQYYLAKTGKKMLHGAARTPLGGAIGRERYESIYESGV